MHSSQKRNLKNGMVPVYMSLSNNKMWKYIQYPIQDIVCQDKSIEFTFRYDFTSEDKEIYFAFTYPYSYQTCQNMLDWYEREFKFDREIYFHRELLTYSLEARKIDMITITGLNQNTKDEELMPVESLLNSLFPKCTSVNETKFKARYTYRPIKFQKRYILISSRIHPGDTPASFMLEGFLKLLLDRDNIVSKALLENFAFVIIPMVNPDGVFRGHYRMDSKGQDLNKMCHEASLGLSPGIYGLISVAQNLAKDGRLFMYLDFHAQSHEDSAFIQANYWDHIEAKLEIRLFARLMDIYSKHFDYENCFFGVKLNNESENKKAGSARVELAKLTELVHCYTLETSYYKSNKQPNKYKDDGEHNNNSSNINGDLMTSTKIFSKILTQVDFEEIGSSLGDAILELVGLHPSSKIVDTIFENLVNVKKYVFQKLNSTSAKKHMSIGKHKTKITEVQNKDQQ